MKNETEQKLLDEVERSIGALVAHALSRLPAGTQALLNGWLSSVCKLQVLIELEPQLSIGIAMVRKDGKEAPVGLVQIVGNGEEQKKVEVGH